MSKITINATGKLQVPQQVEIPFIEGDGVGPEITAVTQKVVNAAIAKAYDGERQILWKEVFAGGKSFKQSGSWLPNETIQAFRDHRVGIKGPLTTPVGEGIRSLNVTLRQELDLYVCLRPIRWFRGVVSPVKEPQKVNMHIFRENTEDIYAGIEWQTGTPEAEKFLKFLTDEMGVSKVRFPQSSSFGVKPVSRDGSQRLVRSAIEYAIARKLPSVTLVHKGNIMKFTEGSFKNWGYDVSETEFAEQTFTMRQYDVIQREQGPATANYAMETAQKMGKVIVKDVIADAFLQNTLLIPEEYSVIATLNLNGDYISDQLAAMVGGIGIAPGANINYLTGHAIFEATHGTAPNIAGSNTVNPSSLLLSAVMMLEYIGWEEAASHIINAMENLFESGRATGDLARFMPGGTALSTSAFGEELLGKL